MKAVRLHQDKGGPDALVVEDVPNVKPGPGEISVRIHRAAFNRRDVFITQGLYPGIELPATLGSDGAGEVAELGEGVEGPPVGTAVVIDPMLGWNGDAAAWGKGTAILGMPHPGTFAEFCVVPKQNVYPKPAALSYDEAAALPLGGLTAYRAVVTRGKVTKDDLVLITGIGGGVQTFALLFAKQAGARTIVTSGSDDKLERAKALGADIGINYKTSPDWAKDVRKASDGGPTLVIDSVGGETFARCLNIARPGARIVNYGGTTGDAKVRMFDIFWKHLDILGTSMGSPDDFAAMLHAFESGARPVVDIVIPMADVASAAKRVLSGEQFGKVVLAIT